MSDSRKDLSNPNFPDVYSHSYGVEALICVEVDDLIQVKWTLAEKKTSFKKRMMKLLT